MITYKTRFVRLGVTACLLAVSLYCFSQSDSESKGNTTVSPTRTLGATLKRESPTLSDRDTLRLYSSSFEGMEKMDSVIQGKRVFITGENHSFTGSNARIWLKMIKYLHAKAGVRNIMFEYGNSYGVLVNEYLNTGDSSLFNSLKYFSYSEYSDVIKELKKFNDSLPYSDKLYFTGIDLDRGVYPIAKALNQLLPADSTGVPDSIAIHIASIRSLAPYNDFKLGQEESVNYNGFQFKTGSTLKLVHDNFKQNEKEYKEYLGEKFKLFSQIIRDEYEAREKWQALQNSGAIQEYHFREKYMHDRFLAEQAAHPGNWFGQFGRCHTTQDLQLNNSCEWFSFSSLADRIESSSSGDFKNKVMTIAIVYDQDRNFGPNKKQTKKLFNKYFEDMEANSTALIDVQQDTSLAQAFGKDFNYLLLNTYNERGEAFSQRQTPNSEDNSVTTWSLLYGSYRLNLDPLNQYFKTGGAASEFSAGEQAFGFGLTTKYDRLTTTSTFYRFDSEDVMLSPDSSGLIAKYSLKGRSFSQLISYSVFPKLTAIKVLPGIGIGYAKFELENTEQAPSNNRLQNGFLGEMRVNQSINDAFIIDVVLDAHLNIGMFILGGKTGYSFDVSNKKWKTAAERLVDSPTTSFSGWYNYVFLGLRL